MSWIYNGRKYWYHNGKKYSCKVKRKKKRIGYFMIHHFDDERPIRQLSYSKYYEVKTDGIFRTYQRYLRDDEQEML